MGDCLRTTVQVLRWVVVVCFVVVNGTEGSPSTSSQQKAGLGRLGQVAFADGPKGEPRMEARTVTVNDADNGKTISLVVGSELVVRLTSNLTTGYTWRIAKGDVNRLRPDGEPVYEASETHLMGAGGTQVFRFTALDAGETELVLEYIRPWEDKPLRTFELLVDATR